MGNKGSNSNNELLFENRNIDPKEDGLDLEKINIFLNKAITCTCKIKLNLRYGIGFFCKLPWGKKNTFKNVLIACHHVLTREDLSSSKDIILEIDKTEIKISKNNRNIYYNPELDYSCIEILNTDNIENFYNIDEFNLRKKLNEKYYINKFIIVISLMKNERPGIFTGIIKSINDKKFIYENNTSLGNCGGIIINPSSNRIIVMHIGENNNIHSKKIKI